LSGHPAWAEESVYEISDVDVVAGLLTITVDRRSFAASNMSAEDKFGGELVA
jgi:hypothetical protein